jgi:energy-coupling factor transport system ATP-binding protein
LIALKGFGWRHAGRKAWAVRGVDLTIERGERVLLLGPSGAGKSTLLAALAGLLAEDSGDREGEFRVDGRAGIVFQDPQTQLVMSRCGDDVAFGLENLAVPAPSIWPRVSEALRAVGFTYPLDRSTAALSGGEAQRLALAGALALRPDLLLLDEPTANLDPAGAALVRSSLRHALTRDTTLVLVEHRVAEVLDLVDRVVVLSPSSGVIADGPPSSVFASHGALLARQGVWTPDAHPPPRRAGGIPGDVLLTATGVALRDRLSTVDISVTASAAVAITGPNGCGKTTLALILGGLLAPTSGSVVASAALAGDDASKPPHRWKARALAKRIGSVFQDPEHQFVTARVSDELALGGVRQSTVDDLLARLGLVQLAGANPFTLSGGEARRLSVATALAAAPRVLVLDEPTFGQDRRTWLEMVDLLGKLRDDGCAVVAVTHDRDFAAALTDTEIKIPGHSS